MTHTRSDYALFLRWLILAGVLFFTAWVLWDIGLLQAVLAADPTRLTLLILLLFLVGTGHCAVRSLYLSAEHGALDRILASGGRIPVTSDDDVSNFRLTPHRESSLAGQMLAGVIHKRRQSSPTESAENQSFQLLAQVMAEQARGQHEVGWFVCSLLIKLGLLGTVVGFVLMLAPMAQLESFDLSDIQGLLQRMTTGMGVALNTTLVGLSCSMLLSLQYLMLDRAADRLVAQTIAFAETGPTSAPGGE